jgi:hypothetical protein
LVDAFDQVAEPLITEITCLRSQELTLFHLVIVYISVRCRGNYGLVVVAAQHERREDDDDDDQDDEEHGFGSLG